MKEAAGEANMTVITIVLIAIVLGVGTVIINNMMSATQKTTKCMEQGLCQGAGDSCVPCNTVNQTTNTTTNG